jgi:general secretion pathway protein D
MPAAPAEEDAEAPAQAPPEAPPPAAPAQPGGVEVPAQPPPGAPHFIPGAVPPRTGGARALSPGRAVAPPPAAANAPPSAAAPVAPAAPAGPAPPAAVGRPPGATAPPPPVAQENPDDKLITMNFQDIELDALVKFISEISGRNFILDDRVKGKVTIISPGKISVDEAYAVFQSVLQVKGFTTVPSGAVLKILPSQEAKSSTVDTIFPGRPFAEGDEFVTQLIPLTNVDVNNMLGIVQPLVSANGLLAAYTSTNTMIIIDSAANIDRIIKILHELDVADRERGIEVMRLNYAFATEIAATLAQVLEEPGNAAPTIAGGAAAAGRRAQPGAPGAPAATRRAQQAGAAGAPAQPVEGGTGQAAYKIIPDERTNALIVVAGPLQMRKIKDLVMRLDVPLPFGTGRMHVYYLKYANVFEITPILSDLIGGGQGVGGLASGLLGRGLTGTTGFRGGRLGQRGGIGGVGQNIGSGGGFGTGFSGQGGFGGLGSNFGSGFSGGGSLRGGSLAGGGAVGGGFGGGQGGVASITGGQNEQFEGIVRISGDPSTNSLIINASPQDYETLKQVIIQLDVRRRQVYIEAIIMEVRLDTTRALGIELQGAAGTGNGILFGRVSFNNLANALLAGDPTGSLSGLVAAAASNQTIRLPNGTTIPAQIALIQATETNNDVNVLSAPNILTTDNQEAEIVVGQNVPFIASTSTSETNLGNVFNTIERRDVGITLRITPQISEGGMVRLNLFEEVSALVVSALINANQLGPVTTIRSATTSVVVRDRQTVVIGGLISDSTDNTESSVPFISDIPVLGNFFRSTRGHREKINLLIFLTPHIIRTATEHRDKSLEERDKLRSAMQEQGVRYKKRKMLEMPSWTPDLSEKGGGDHESDEGQGATIFRPEPIPPAGTTSVPGASAAQPANQGLTIAERTAPEPRPSDEAAIEPAPPANGGPYHCVLLAAFAEQGAPPPGLQSASGLIAVNLPPGSRLTTLFEPGMQYRFSSDKFEASYRVLEAYPTSQEALLVYPEGLPVDAAKGDYLHWREFKDPTSADPTAWTALK